ncbi:MAG: hypothetical protein RL460_642 [Actinomycetota bacterium]
MDNSLTIRRLPDLPVISVIMPVFNQERNVKSALNGLIDSLSSPFEIILVDDGSEDSTYTTILDWTRSRPFIENNFDFTLIRNKKSVFETACDNLGFRSARGEFMLEVQADMVIRDPKFDLRMMQAFRDFPDLAILSGRGVTTLDSVAAEFQRLKSDSFSRFVIRSFRSEAIKIYTAVKKSFLPKQFESTSESYPIVEDRNLGFGRLGMAICTDIGGVFDLDEVFFGPYVMRGPLMVSKNALGTLGSLDSRSFYLGFDDAEWCLLARRHELTVAFHPVLFDSELNNGATRKRRSLRQFFAILRNERRSRKPSRDTLLWEFKPGKEEVPVFSAKKLSRESPRNSN